MNWLLETLSLPAGLLISFCVTYAIREKLLRMITAAGFVRPNYRGEAIPLGAGIIFFVSALITVTLLIVFWPQNLRSLALVFLFSIGGATCLGLIDDFWGTRDATGLLGHFKALLSGRLTTGAVKAIGGGLIAIIVAVQLYPGNWLRIIDSSLIIALSINLVNLFDLRPGRAGKIFILACIVIMPPALGRPEAVMAAIILGSVLAYLGADLKARAMMGDAGSNTLGMVVGVTAAAVLDGYFRILYLAVLVLIHIITERYSLTSIISGNVFLNYLDMLGREKDSGNRCRN
ncbi:UDP-N-acetylmuramyl pentapeptide phosphotransferase/UDP-N-acetylglucosamine-1-phosphate transferase [Desulfotomaculum arcticum]|uniref:UDP-N-acetylmuramyl pentapeptide phosphotransferase/UDP-N-acetylglucosamine-1-phosphate transferase n=1 Tax=Desulfotruncus arcticus DSM 17038 TaxID=1121424 RepID=A0A1I2MWU8_9FIRM|nr:hypothetical protein [Desulfotruncus arcticus]SFF93947.1 UDP-N-acetylmuramyl pentapeptide phosphotransferase/UDP-N-acetylglucosamine-1-phosphate transferase [Desulfotomaculum arcticum] [Desulfotruncus arcticus DSM 17038]